MKIDGIERKMYAIGVKIDKVVKCVQIAKEILRDPKVVREQGKSIVKEKETLRDQKAAADKAVATAKRVVADRAAVAKRAVAVEENKCLFNMVSKKIVFLVKMFYILIGRE